MQGTAVLRWRLSPLHIVQTTHRTTAVLWTDTRCLFRANHVDNDNIHTPSRGQPRGKKCEQTVGISCSLARRLGSTARSSATGQRNLEDAGSIAGRPGKPQASEQNNRHAVCVLPAKRESGEHRTTPLPSRHSSCTLAGRAVFGCSYRRKVFPWCRWEQGERAVRFSPFCRSTAGVVSSLLPSTTKIECTLRMPTRLSASLPPSGSILILSRVSCLHRLLPASTTCQFFWFCLVLPRHTLARIVWCLQSPVSASPRALVQQCAEKISKLQKPSNPCRQGTGAAAEGQESRGKRVLMRAQGTAEEGGRSGQPPPAVASYSLDRLCEDLEQQLATSSKEEVCLSALLTCWCLVCRGRISRCMLKITLVSAVCSVDCCRR